MSHQYPSTIFILVPEHHKSYRIHPFTIVDQDTSSSLLLRLEDLIAHEPRGHLALRALSFGTVTLSIACISQQSLSSAIHTDLFKQSSSLESGTIPSSQISSFRKNIGMTNSIRTCGPSTLDVRAQLLHQLHSSNDPTDTSVRVWCFHPELNLLVLSLWIFLTLGILTSIGLIVAFSIIDSKLGLSLGTGLLAVFTTVQGILIMYAAH